MKSTYHVRNNKKCYISVGVIPEILPMLRLSLAQLSTKTGRPEKLLMENFPVILSFEEMTVSQS